ncbi:MAG: SCO7613 C-terminal domain-containing membrane protein [Actinomycetes bacterium]
MTRYADPQRCPDCHGPIGADHLVCPACGLPLRGTTAAELFRVLTTADTLLAQLRATAAVGAATVGAATVSAGAGAGPVAPGGSAGSAGPGPGLSRRHGLSAASVPKILLGLGAVCLLVAALVFLAVTWSAMGVGGRTATLVGFTALTGGLAAWMCRRDLRGAAEALSLVSLGLLTMDVFGARAAGWFGDVSTPAFLVVLGGLLLAGGSGASLLARRTPVGSLTAPELVAGVGVALLTVGTVELRAEDTALLLVVATVLAGALTWAAARLALRFTAAMAAVVAALAWVGQLLHALEATREASFSALWGRGDVLELLVSATLAGSLVLVRELPTAARLTGGALGVTVLAVALAVPAFDESGTVATLAGLGALAGAGALAWLLPRPWGVTAVLLQVVAGAGVLISLAAISAPVAERLAEVAAAGWGGHPGDLLPAATAGIPAPWLAPLIVLVLFASAAALARASAVLDDAVSAVTDLRAAAGLLVAAAVVTLASYPVPVWTVVAALLVSAAAFLAWWTLRPGAVSLVVAAAFLLGAVVVGGYDEWFTVATSTGVLAAAGLVHLRATRVETAAVAGALAPAALTADVWAWGALVGAEGTWTGLAGLLLLAAATLTLHLYPDPWWRCGGAAAARSGVEAGAAAVAVPLGLAGVLAGEAGRHATWTAVYLTVAGAAVVALSLVRTDRRLLAWPGSGLLVLATWVRLADLGVNEPEPYTLPAAVALVLVGIVRLRRDPASDTMGALGPGLTLALIPSLLWALDDPMTLRGLLLGLACLALVLVGLQGKWSAPLVIGATVGGVLVVRMAGPYVDAAVPRWVLIGAAGALLIATGVTWERRLQEARTVVGYVRSLR